VSFGRKSKYWGLGLHWIWHQFWLFALVTALLCLCPQMRVSTGQSVSAVRRWPVGQCLCVSVPRRHDRSCGRRGIASFLKPSSWRFPTCYRLRNEEFIVLSVRVSWWHEQSHDCASIISHMSSYLHRCQHQQCDFFFLIL